MTALLASVRSASEAAIALAAGADVIDAKEPSAGALGGLDPATIAQIVAVVAGRARTSATIGDLPFETPIASPAIDKVEQCGVDFIKIGWFPSARVDPRATARTLARAHGRIRLVAVLLADRAPQPEWLPLLGEHGWAGVMLDTADKSGGNLRRHLDAAHLAQFAAAARSAGLMFGLAGSLRAEDIEPLLDLAPDFVGFRGALTADAGRESPLDFDAVARIRACIPRGSRGSEN
jgi:uncharacterized protein (UPF0264 family)